MITDRDKNIIDFINKIGYSSIQNIQDMFFVNNRYGYDGARKRLKKIEEMGDYIRHFKNQETNEIIYIPSNSKLKRISTHNIKVLNYITKLSTLGCKITNVELEPVFNNIKPDAFIEFEFNNYKYYQLIEVQIRHDYVDLNRFKNQETIESILNYTENVMPKLIIIQDTNRDYSKDNDTEFNIIQIGVSMDDIAKVLI